MANKKLEAKLKELPQEPGVYFHKNNQGEIIYVGKAANLKNRVRSYFQTSKTRDFKTQVLVKEIRDTDWVTVGSEIDALFLESAMIKRYQPKYNILLRDDKNFLYIKIPMKDTFPTVSYTRRPLDDDATYFGPYTSSWGVKRAMKYLRKAFPYVTHRQMPNRACFHYHLGLCPGPEVDAVSSKDYKKNLKRLSQYLEGEGGRVQQALKKEMESLAKKKEFEAAAAVRDKLNALRSLSKQHLFGDKELFDLTRDQALTGLQELLELPSVPRRIEAYDISHTQGTNNVASMVVFTDGVPNRGEYRKFKMRLGGNDDFAHMREVITRRLGHWEDWPKPDLLVIDGGKGQLGAALEVIAEKQLPVRAIGLAKREEEIVQREENDTFTSIRLDKSSHVLQLLMHIRDEAHRFAVTYHSVLRSQGQTNSILEEIPGVGAATRKKLIKRFGSYRGVKKASHFELSQVVGAKKATTIQEYLR